MLSLEDFLACNAASLETALYCSLSCLVIAVLKVEMHYVATCDLRPVSIRRKLQV